MTSGYRDESPAELTERKANREIASSERGWRLGSRETHRRGQTHLQATVLSPAKPENTKPALRRRALVRDCDRWAAIVIAPRVTGCRFLRRLDIR